jgi:uncharacterized membrane protein YccC
MPDARLRRRLQSVTQVALSHFITNGLAVGLGQLVITLVAFHFAGLAAVAAVTAGVVITTVPDTATPQRGKLLHLLPAPLLGLPLFLAVQLLHGDPVRLGAVLVAGSLLAALGTAWGKRGGAVTFSLIFSMVLSMATPAPVDLAQALERAAWFGVGALAYLPWGLAAAAVLNMRYRRQLLASCLLSLGELLRTQSRRFEPEPDPALPGLLLRQQAVLADQLQHARDLVLEQPDTPQRLRLAAMLLAVLEARDHLVACELDLDAVVAGRPAALPGLRQALERVAAAMESLGMDMLLGRTPQPAPPPWPRPARAATDPLLRSIADRIGHIDEEARRITGLARGEQEPALDAVRSQWKLFVSPARWGRKPLASLLSLRAPVLRHALRLSLAIGAGYTVALFLPWATHKYWIVLTIAVVMRASLSQTVERGNARVAGTMVGSLAAVAILASHPSTVLLLVLIALGTTFAHGLALRAVATASVASAVLGLLQTHLLHAVGSSVFAAGERLADTLIGALLAWAFSYVLPSWERSQLPALVRRAVAAQARHAQLALALGEPGSADLEWRLARREAYDSLSALVLACGRALAEPPSVRPAFEPLETLQVRSYQFLAQLTSIKSMLLLRRAELDLEQAQPALREAAQRIAQVFSAGADAAAAAPLGAASQLDAAALAIPDAMPGDLTPWLLRRLRLATGLAAELRQAAARVPA